MKKPAIYIINGPNLNRLGRRDRSLYGSRSLADIERYLIRRFQDMADLKFFCHNCEGDIIDTLQKAGDDEFLQGVVINPGAYAHYSYAIADAIADLRSEEIPVIEVHLTNIAAREEYRRRSVTAAQCTGIISGFGDNGYMYAIETLLNNGEGA